MTLVSMLSSLLIIVVFGPVMPPLLLAAPFYMWCNLCSLRWIQRNSTMPFGQVLAATVLIQKPVSIFEVMALSLTWIVSVCVCFDVQFSTIHIIVLSGVFMLVQVPASIILKARDNLPKDEGTDDVFLEIGDSEHATLSPAGSGMKHDLAAADLDEMEAQNVTIERRNSNYFSRSSKKDFLTDLKSGDITVMENPVAPVARSPRSSSTKPNTSPKNKQKRAATWFRGQAADRGVEQTDHRNDRDNSSNATDMVAVSPRAQAASRAKRHTKLDTPLAKLKKLKESAKHRDQEWHAIQQRHATERNELKDSTASRADRASSAAHPQSLKKAHASESSTNHHAQRTPGPQTPRSPRSPRKLKQSGPESPKRSQSPRQSKQPPPTTPKRIRSPRKSKQHKSPNDETLAL